MNEYKDGFTPQGEPVGESPATPVAGQATPPTPDTGAASYTWRAGEHKEDTGYAYRGDALRPDETSPAGPAAPPTGYGPGGAFTGGYGGQAAGYGPAGGYSTPARYENQQYYGGYYGGPYYTGSYTASQGQAPVTAPPHGGGTTVATKAQKESGGRGRWVLLVAAMLLVALVAGFGGGYLANLRYSGGGSTVVYRAAEGGATGRSTNVDSMSLSEVAAVAKESVVSIITENIVTNPFAGGEVQSGAGSGVVLSEDGYIITNNHVIDGADNVVVTLPDGSDLDARVVGSDATSDIAVLKVEASGLVPAILGDSGALLVGDLCLAVGNPMGTLGGTVTDGIISALDREVTIDGNTMNLLQMSAAVSPGNSGGGLFNANGELVGIVNAKSNGDKTEGLGFAIPINTAMNVAEDLINLGYVSGRPAMGVKVQYISTAEQALQKGVTELGVYIAEVTPGGAAEAAGIQVGDRVVSFGGVDIDSTTALTGAIRKQSVGDTVEMVVSRGGERLNISITLGEMQGES